MNWKCLIGAVGKGLSAVTGITLGLLLLSYFLRWWLDVGGKFMEELFDVSRANGSAIAVGCVFVAVLLMALIITYYDQCVLAHKKEKLNE